MCAEIVTAFIDGRSEQLDVDETIYVPLQGVFVE